MTKDEVLKLALEALKEDRAWLESAAPKKVWDKNNEAITAIKEALAQPEQEPVAWGCNRYIEDDNGFQIGTDEPELAWGKYAPDDNGWWPLYTTPPQRKPLSDEEIVLIVAECAASHQHTDIHFARAIEAAHGIKETEK